MHLCQICGEEGQDRRVLRLQYFSDLSAFSDKFEEEKITTRLSDGREVTEEFYSICTCRECRGDFQKFLRQWARGDFAEHYQHTGQSFVLAG